MKEKFEHSLVWFRRDLRIHDHIALSQACEQSKEVSGVFVFDTKILDKLPKKDKRLVFIIDCLKELEENFLKYNSSLHILYGDPTKEIPALIKKIKAKALFFNRDYEVYAKKRDGNVFESCKQIKVPAFSFKDSVFFESKEVLTKSETVYKVFTPYKNQWLSQLPPEVPIYKPKLKKLKSWENKKSIIEIDWLTKMGFKNDNPPFAGGTKAAKKKLRIFRDSISQYHEERDYPALDGTSNISAYIRHGAVSVRDLVREGLERKTDGHKIWLSEVIWRDFYHAILDAFPHVEKKSFKAEYDQIKWLGKTSWFKAWCEGQTGFPLIDAAMRCLNETGLMHNRLRMVTASFLCKILLTDWRKGEAYFAEKLLDFDKAANNGGWQWSSSSGCDAQPYFRIFNPYTQSEKFDKNGDYIKRWCPELSYFSPKHIHSPHLTDMLVQSEAKCIVGEDYPHPIVDYKRQRKECELMYQAIKNKT